MLVLPNKLEAYQTQITIYDGPPIAVSVPQRLNESISITITAANGQKFYSSVNSTTNYVERTFGHTLTSSELTLGEDVIRVKATRNSGADVPVTNMTIIQSYSVPDIPSIQLSETDGIINYSFNSLTAITYAAWIYGYYDYETDEVLMRSYGNELGKITNSSFYKKSGNILVSKNGVYSFFIKNEEGYTVAKQIVINYFDQTPPVITITDTGSGITSNPIIMNVETTDDSLVSIKKWAYGNQNITYFNSSGTSFSGNQIEITQNGTYTIYAKDVKGNESVKTFSVTRITPPETNPPIITITDTGSGKTKDPITMNVNITDESPIAIKKWIYGNKTIPDFASSGTIFNTNQIQVTEYGTYTVYASDSQGNESVKTFHISRITSPETNPPIININVTGNSSHPGEQMDINYEILDQSLLVSKKFGIGIRNIAYFQNNGELVPEVGTKKVLQNGYYTFYAKDDYGNEVIKSVLVTGIPEPYDRLDDYIHMTGTFGNNDKAVFFHGNLPSEEVKVYLLQNWIDYEAYLYYFLENDPRNYQVNISEENLFSLYYDHLEYITNSGPYTAIVVTENDVHFDYLDSADQSPIYDVLEDEIIIENNGSIIESESHSTIITIKNRGYSSTMFSQYQWTNSSLPSSATPYEWTEFVSGDNIQKSGVSGDYYLHITTMDEEGNEKTFVSNKFVFKEVVESQLFDLGNIDFGIISLTPGSEQKVKAKSSLNKIEYVQDIANEQNYQITMTVAPFLSASGSQIDANNFKLLKAQSINSMGTEITGSFEFQNNTPVTMVTSNSGGFYDPTHLIVNSEDIELTIPASFIPNSIESEVLTSSITYSVITIP